MLADLFELGEGGGLAVDKAAAFAFGIDDAADAELVALVEQALLVQLRFEGGQGGEVE